MSLFRQALACRVLSVPKKAEEKKSGIATCVRVLVGGDLEIWPPFEQGSLQAAYRIEGRLINQRVRARVCACINTCRIVTVSSPLLSRAYVGVRLLDLRHFPPNLACVPTDGDDVLSPPPLLGAERDPAPSHTRGDDPWGTERAGRKREKDMSCGCTRAYTCACAYLHQVCGVYLRCATTSHARQSCTADDTHCESCERERERKS